MISKTWLVSAVSLLLLITRAMNGTSGHVSHGWNVSAGGLPCKLCSLEVDPRQIFLTVKIAKNTIAVLFYSIYIRRL